LKIFRLLGRIGLVVSEEELGTLQHMVTSYCLGETFPLLDDPNNGFENVRYTVPRTQKYWEIFAKIAPAKTHTSEESGGAEETPPGDN